MGRVGNDADTEKLVDVLLLHNNMILTIEYESE
jgi:hypothetical protein